MDYKQEADKIVEIFYEIIADNVGYVGAIMGLKETAVKSAIKHVERMLEELDIYDTKDYSEHCVARIQYYDELLNQLKQM